MKKRLKQRILNEMVHRKYDVWDCKSDYKAGNKKTAVDSCSKEEAKTLRDNGYYLKLTKEKEGSLK